MTKSIMRYQRTIQQEGRTRVAAEDTRVHDLDALGEVERERPLVCTLVQTPAMECGRRRVVRRGIELARDEEEVGRHRRS